MAFEGKARVLTIAEFRRAEKAAMLTRHGLRNRAMLYLTFAIALRACELRRLRIRDVLQPDGSIAEDINLLKHMTKGNKQRHVYLTNRKARDALAEYITYMKKKIESQRYNNIFDIDAPLFPSQKGGEFTPTDMIRVFRQIYRIAGLEGARSHSGRRTFITYKIDEGCDLKAIADLAGHEDINSTIGYHQKNPNRLKKISEKSIF